MHMHPHVPDGCEQRTLVEGWRKIFSETPGTTDPLAPFGIVTCVVSVVVKWCCGGNENACSLRTNARDEWLGFYSCCACVIFLA